MEVVEKHLIVFLREFVVNRWLRRTVIGARPMFIISKRNRVDEQPSCEEINAEYIPRG